MSHLLMYNDTPVARFDTLSRTAVFLHRTMLPYAMDPDNCGYGDIAKFCSDRILMHSRNYCKEILDACKIDDQDDMAICLLSHGLSFRDNYWIKEEKENLSWKKINLYQNEFSEDIAVTALTGEIRNVHIGDKLFTGELTGKGTRAKCYIRQGDRIYLAKQETQEEISSEVLSGYLCRWLNMPGTDYVNTIVYGKDCSVCQIKTSPSVELIPARDVLTRTGSTMSAEGGYYSRFFECDPLQFAKMQVFDYITLNSDRNRDNFALRRERGRITGLYPVFDHDSCFKAKSIQGHYFVTGTTFSEVPKILSMYCPEETFARIIEDTAHFSKELQKPENRELCMALKGHEIYDGICEHTEQIFSSMQKLLKDPDRQKQKLVAWLKDRATKYKNTAQQLRTLAPDTAKRYLEAAEYIQSITYAVKDGKEIPAIPQNNTVLQEFARAYEDRASGNAGWDETTI